ncbi:MAG: hypothetical protein R3D59_04305 [Paracoccaceae bacterium]
MRRAVRPNAAAALLRDHTYYVIENLAALRNTRIGNLMGASALTLPTGVPSTGIMFLGAPFGGETPVIGAAEAALACGHKPLLQHRGIAAFFWTGPRSTAMLP